MDLLPRNASLESHVRRKLSRVVRRGGVGKASRNCVPQLSMQTRWLAGSLPYCLSGSREAAVSKARTELIYSFYPIGLTIESGRPGNTESGKYQYSAVVLKEGDVPIDRG